LSFKSPLATETSVSIKLITTKKLA